jgi:hypothetical protein
MMAPKVSLDIAFDRAYNGTESHQKTLPHEQNLHLLQGNQAGCNPL